MYCDFQIYTPMMVPNIVPTPSMISSNQLFKGFILFYLSHFNRITKKFEPIHSQ
jgi:hypothetical protein